MTRSMLCLNDHDFLNFLNSIDNTILKDSQEIMNKLP